MGGGTERCRPEGSRASLALRRAPCLPGCPCGVFLSEGWMATGRSLHALLVEQEGSSSHLPRGPRGVPQGRGEASGGLVPSISPLQHRWRESSGNSSSSQEQHRHHWRRTVRGWECWLRLPVWGHQKPQDTRKTRETPGKAESCKIGEAMPAEGPRKVRAAGQSRFRSRNTRT